jgi:hypothetical protein
MPCRSQTRRKIILALGYELCGKGKVFREEEKYMVDTCNEIRGMGGWRRGKNWQPVSDSEIGISGSSGKWVRDIFTGIIFGID